MSLDIYLRVDGGGEPVSVERIFVRKDGGNVELSREEWDEMFPDQEPFMVREEIDGSEVFHANITHNLAEMAERAGLYEAMWCPDEAGFATAGELIGPLERSLERLESDPVGFSRCNPKNGWGSYEGLVESVRTYLQACRIWPEAVVEVSR